MGKQIVTNITVKTMSCSGCSAGPVEQGLQVQLVGLMELANCTSDNLDNPEKQDYSTSATASFDSLHGIGGCGVGIGKSLV